MESMSYPVAQSTMLLQDLQTVHMLLVSFLATTVYDIVLSFPDEVDWIWHAPWSSGKILYISSRYPPLFLCVLWLLVLLGLGDPVYTDFCLGMTHLLPWASWVISIPVQAILYLRALAVWERNRNIAILLSFGATFYYISLITCSIIAMRQPNSNTMDGCYSANPSVAITLTKYSLGSTMCYDGMIFFVILTKVLQERGERLRLLDIVFRDGAIYCAVQFAVSAVNVAIAVAMSPQRPIFSQALPIALVVAQSIGGCHIILSLRKYSYAERPLPRLGSIYFATWRTLVDELAGHSDSDFSPTRT